MGKFAQQQGGGLDSHEIPHPCKNRKDEHTAHKHCPRVISYVHKVEAAYE